MHLLEKSLNFDIENLNFDEQNRYLDYEVNDLENYILDNTLIIIQSSKRNLEINISKLFNNFSILSDKNFNWIGFKIDLLEEEVADLNK